MNCGPLLLALLGLIVPSLLSATTLPCKAQSTGCRSSNCAIDIVKLADDAPGYATFASDIPHVATNRHGIFVTYLAHEAPGSAGSSYGDLFEWVLKRSSDGGRTFATIFWAQPRYGKAPEIETDEDGNIYLFAVDYSPPGTDATSNDMLMYTFKPADNYAHPRLLMFPGEAAGKFTALYDQDRHQFYYIGFGETPFLVLDRNGRITHQYQLLKGGKLAGAEYPFLAMDGPRLYAAWTTTPAGDCGGTPQNWHCNLPVYYSIHFIYSDDGGVSWRAPGGKALTLPIVSDTGGPAPNIVPPAYLGKQPAWLAGFTVFHNAAHFMYSTAHQTIEIYQTYSVAPYALTRQIENRLSPTPSGDFGDNGFRAFALDGFLTRGSDDALFAITADLSKQTYSPIYFAYPLVVLRSRNGGSSAWATVAHSRSFGSLYGINGPRLISPDFGPVGIFSASLTASTDRNSHQVYFFRVSNTSGN